MNKKDKTNFKINYNSIQFNSIQFIDQLYLHVNAPPFLQDQNSLSFDYF